MTLRMIILLAIIHMLVFSTAKTKSLEEILLLNDSLNSLYESNELSHPFNKTESDENRNLLEEIIIKDIDSFDKIKRDELINKYNQLKTFIDRINSRTIFKGKWKSTENPLKNATFGSESGTIVFIIGLAQVSTNFGTMIKALPFELINNYFCILEVKMLIFNDSDSSNDKYTFMSTNISNQDNYYLAYNTNSTYSINDHKFKSSINLEMRLQEINMLEEANTTCKSINIKI